MNAQTDDTLSTMTKRYGYPDRFKELITAGTTGTVLRQGVRVAQHRDKELRSRTNMYQALNLQVHVSEQSESFKGVTFIRRKDYKADTLIKVRRSTKATDEEGSDI